VVLFHFLQLVILTLKDAQSRDWDDEDAITTIFCACVMTSSALKAVSGDARLYAYLEMAGRFL
jgi:hypothetical protein